MHKQKKALFVLAIIGAISTFLPWVSIPFLSINGTNGGDGWITLGLFAVTIVLIYIDKEKLSPLGGWQKIISAVAGILASVVAVINIVNLKDELGELNSFGESGLEMDNIVSIGYGLYLIVAMGILVAVAAFVLAKG